MLLPLLYLPTSSPPLHSLLSSATSLPSASLLKPARPARRFHPLLASSAPVRPPATSPDKLGASALKRISEKLRSLGYLPPSPPTESPGHGGPSPGEIFIPTPQELPALPVGATLDRSFTTPESPVPVPASGYAISRYSDLWRRASRPRVIHMGPSAAELIIPEGELRRLRSLGIKMTKKLTVGKAGITEGIVNGIHERWRRIEVVKIKCEDLCRVNMKQTHEILERKTGGLVIWRSGSIIILYRGANYKYPYFHRGDQNIDDNENQAIHTNAEEVSDDGSDMTLPVQVHSKDKIPSRQSHNNNTTAAAARLKLVSGVGSPNKVRFPTAGEIELVEQADRLLDGLGPRFSDWWGCDPLPVDADLLPAIIPGFRRPFRLLPFGVKPKLTDSEMTVLRRLGRPLPCHFALGRNRKLQGLAASIIKLWEKCEIAKIAIKRGVQNTNNEMMAEELKQLTGGTILSRNKEFIVLYRGKDFLPLSVSVAIEERRKSAHSVVDKQGLDVSTKSLTGLVSKEGCKEEKTKEIGQEKDKLKLVGTRVQRIETKLLGTIAKKERAEKLLAELEKNVKPTEVEVDKEAISEEERYMLRKVGLRMKPFLLLGRRGVFDGTVENMHLHWKYRELVKVICKERNIEDVRNAARVLEVESGGILIAVEPTNKGHAIIVYRGKNYRRPTHLRPQSLLNKKEALKRSLEAQRCQSLKLHVLKLSEDIEKLRDQMVSPSQQSEAKQPEEPICAMNTDEIKRDDKLKCNDMSNTSAEFEANTEVHEVISETLASAQDRTASDDEVCESVEQMLLSEAHGTAVSNNSQDVASCCVSDHSAEAEIHNEPPGIFTPQRMKCDSVEENGREQSGDVKKDDVSHNFYFERKLETGYIQGSPFRLAPLTNKERLVLRKQALKMRKRPVLAVGRGNVISGVAKTIRTHFKKHPLAIVDIKGRATGTSVQQLIFELEEATSAVLVSREPNKVILYRGWGYGENSPTNTKRLDNVVSPQLVEAIRRECSLDLCDHDKQHSAKDEPMPL